MKVSRRVLWTGLIVLSGHACKTPQAASSLQDSELSAPSTTPLRLDLNDVSVLFPLPGSGAEAFAIGIDAAGAKGPLLPRTYFRVLPGAGVPPDSVPDLLDHMTIVAMRIDPCFPSIADLAHCSRQMRLVAQPVRREGGRVTVDDAAIHLFYTLTGPEFERLLLDLVQIKSTYPVSTDGRALAVHPGLLAAGLNSELMGAYKALILKNCGKTNLVRMALMQTGETGDSWNFGTFDIAHSRLTPLKIPRIDATTQVFSNPRLTIQPIPGSPLPDPRNGSITPAPPATDSIADLLKSTDAILGLSDATFSLEMDAALRIDNPDVHSSATIDCVSCHLATRARAFAVATRPFDVAARPSTFTPVAGYNADLTAAADDGTSYATRNFGYLDQSPAIVERTVNESIAVARYLNDVVLPTLHR